MSVIEMSSPNAGTITVVNADGSVTIIPGRATAPFRTYPNVRTRFARNMYSKQAVDSTIESNTDGGYSYSRPRNTNFDKYEWNLGYDLMPDSDKKIIEAFQRSRGNKAGLFNWMDPVDGQVYLCKFSSTINWTYLGFGSASGNSLEGNLWSATFKVMSIRTTVTYATRYIPGMPYGAVSPSKTYTQFQLAQNLTSQDDGIIVFLNGLQLVPSSFNFDRTTGIGTFTDGTVVSADDDIMLFTYGKDFNPQEVNDAFVETVGQLDGVNKTYTLSSSTVGRRFVLVFLNGLLQRPGFDYSISGNTINFAVAPQNTDILNTFIW